MSLLCVCIRLEDFSSQLAGFIFNWLNKVHLYLMIPTISACSRRVERRVAALLTLLVAGSKIYIRWRGGVRNPPPSKHPKSLWKTTPFH